MAIDPYAGLRQFGSALAGTIQQRRRNALEDLALEQQRQRQAALSDINAFGPRILEAAGGDVPTAMQDFLGLAGSTPGATLQDVAAFGGLAQALNPPTQPSKYEKIVEGSTPGGERGLFGIRTGKPAELIPGITPFEKKPLVNISQGKGQTAFAKKRGEIAAQQLADIEDKASSAAERRTGIQLQRTVLEEGLKTGTFAPFVNSIAAVAESLGADPTKLNLPDPSKGQIFDQASFKNLLDTLAAQKGPQTEGDAQRAMKTFAQMSNTVDANIFILDYMEALANRQETMAEFVNARLPDDARPQDMNKALGEFRRYARRTPLVAKSPNTGQVTTYYKYKAAAQKAGLNDTQIDDNWRRFSGVK